MGLPSFWTLEGEDMYVRVALEPTEQWGGMEWNGKGHNQV